MTDDSPPAKTVAAWPLLNEEKLVFALGNYSPVSYTHLTLPTIYSV